ncbi:Protein of unknown function [Propionibacterium freudenreichii]|nr:Protein of unknown function [Propionibacterium freudenreichii subsp. freudenreichii]CEG87855.1 Protein of unknown function [Propionibacterium freudenreichii]
MSLAMGHAEALAPYLAP